VRSLTITIESGRPRRGSLANAQQASARSALYDRPERKTKAEPVLTRDALKARIRTAADQVAGNLF
jgi:hypothetical protein